ncbi:hypothetical protein [Acetobacter persici]|uniref:Uncharacterized protein n=1 Tax=Acetobacter persici TaxID=1076596 RepID=A0A1U9LIL5_9PROT|nr:hypothetical protein [Acetobacter persici]AQT06293.1 hypothetical protein A0U91_14805 [Acetobacter persici]
MRELAKLALIRPKTPAPKKPRLPVPPGVARGGYVLFENVAERKYIVREVSGISRAKGEVSLLPDENELINRRDIPFSLILYASQVKHEVKSVGQRLNRASSRYRRRQKDLQDAFLKEFQDIIGKCPAPR